MISRIQISLLLKHFIIYNTMPFTEKLDISFAWNFREVKRTL